MGGGVGGFYRRRLRGAIGRRWAFDLARVALPGT